MQIKKTTKEATQLASTEAFKVKQHSNAVFIEGFANKATIDRGDEIIATDAWELDNYMANPIILFNHGMDRMGGTPVGKATEVKPTEEGLYIKVRLSNSNSPDIKMVRDLVEERILRAFSVGFEPKEVENVEVDGKSIKKITKGELFEVSIVGVPMNQDSLFEVSAKSLQTKSLHQIKHEYLEAIKCPVAMAIHDHLPADDEERAEEVRNLADDLGYKINQFKDLLAGDGEFKEADLIHIGEVIGADLMKIKAEGMDEDDEEDDEEKEEKAKDPDSQEDGEEDKEEKSAEDTKVKDFQECVNSKIPKLIDEGKERDEAVAAAISMCQEEGKCQLTEAGKMAAYSAIFSAMDGEGLDTLNLEAIEFVTQKEADEAEVKQDNPDADNPQLTQAPTEAIPSDSKADTDFGNPYLDGQKQTNVLLGALISEIQKLSAKFDGLTVNTTVESENTDSKDSEIDAEAEGEKAASVDFAKKRLEDLEKRLKNLGC